MEKIQKGKHDEMVSVRLWGSRGSMPRAGAAAAVYGGNTACVSVEWGDQIVLFDAGTGIVPCGQDLAADKEIHLFLSHYHLDHVMGVPMFRPFFQSGRSIHVYGESVNGVPVDRWLGKLFRKPFWPVSPQEFPAHIHWHEVKPGQELQLPQGAELRTFRSNHPDDCLNYRLQVWDVSVVYGQDCEVTASNREEFQAFAEACDLLIFDGAYSQEEYRQFAGYGHSTWQQGAELAKQCRAGQLWIAHHAWEHTDEMLREWEAELQGRNENAVFGRDGMQIQLRRDRM